MSDASAHWDGLWVNARLATMTGGGATYGAIHDGAIGVADGRIAWVGPRADLPHETAHAVHDAGGRWITPGLVDCHTHIVHGGERSRAFELWLEGASHAEVSQAGGGIVSTVAQTHAASDDELLASAARCIADLRAGGVTTLEIKSGYGLDCDTEIKMLRVALRLGEALQIAVQTSFLGAHALPAEYDGRSGDDIDFICNEAMPAVHGEGLADAVDGFCETIGFTLAETEKVFEAADDLGLPVKLHAEQLSDMGGAQLAAAHGALSADHLEFLSQGGVRAMAEAGTVAVLLPGAYYFLRAPQLPPMDASRDHGVPLAISTDANPGSSPVSSLPLMVNMAYTLYRTTPEEALAGVTRNGARALGLGASHGTLEEGKAVDFVLRDIEQPAELAYRIGANSCYRVV